MWSVPVVVNKKIVELSDFFLREGIEVINVKNIN